MKWKWIECISCVHFTIIFSEYQRKSIIFSKDVRFPNHKTSHNQTNVDSILWSPSHEISAIVYPKMCVGGFGGCRIDAAAWSLITHSGLISERCKRVCWTISTFPAFSRALSGLRGIKYALHYSPLVVVEIICHFVYSCVHFVETIRS